MKNIAIFILVINVFSTSAKGDMPQLMPEKAAYAKHILHEKNVKNVKQIAGYLTNVEGSILLDQLLKKYSFYKKQSVLDTLIVKKTQNQQDTDLGELLFMCDMAGYTDSVITRDEILKINHVIESYLNQIIPLDVKKNAVNFYESARAPSEITIKNILRTETNLLYFNVKNVGTKYYSLDHTYDSIVKLAQNIDDKHVDFSKKLDLVCQEIEMLNRFDYVITPSEFRNYMQIKKRDKRKADKHFRILSNYKLQSAYIAEIKVIAEETFKNKKKKFKNHKSIFFNPVLEPLRYVLETMDKNEDKYISESEFAAASLKFRKKGYL